MKSVFSFLIFLFSIQCFAQSNKESRIQRIEPPFWWVGMHHTQVQLMVYGKNIAESTPTINYDGVSIDEVLRVSNSNYLFIYLTINPSTKAGVVNIDLKGKDFSETINYTLRERKEGSADRKGFSNADVLYLLMPDRFSNGDPSNDTIEGMLEKADRNNPDGRHGGDIQGILNHLDYIADLGVTGLWINPLLENNNPSYSYHGYAITDFYRIDPRFGSNEEYLHLVEQCHSKNLKVVMDMVFNHCSKLHWLIKDLPSSRWIHRHDTFTKSNFRASTLVDPHASEYDRELMLTGWFDKNMADLDQRN